MLNYEERIRLLQTHEMKNQRVLFDSFKLSIILVIFLILFFVYGTFVSTPTPYYFVLLSLSAVILLYEFAMYRMQKYRNRSFSNINSVKVSYFITGLLLAAILPAIKPFISIIIVFEYSNFQSNPLNILIYMFLEVFVIALLAIVTNFMLIKIALLNEETNKIEYFVNSPAEVSYLSSVLTVGFISGTLVLYSGLNYYNKNLQLNGFSFSLAGITAFDIIFSFYLYFGIFAALTSRLIFKFSNGIYLKQPSRSSVLKAIGYLLLIYLFLVLLGLFVLNSYFSKLEQIIFTTQAVNSNILINSLIIPNFLSWGIITVYIISHLSILTQLIFRDRYCKSCNRISTSKSDFCENCQPLEQNSKKLINISFFKRKIHVPNCPSCQKTWNSLSRRCDKCGFTLLIICDFCGNTINPLWKTCAYCKSDLIPVPEEVLRAEKLRYIPQALTGRFLIYIMLGIVLTTNLLIITYYYNIFVLAVYPELQTYFIRVLGLPLIYSVFIAISILPDLHYARAKDELVSINMKISTEYIKFILYFILILFSFYFVTLFLNRIIVFLMYVVGLSVWTYFKVDKFQAVVHVNKEET